MDMMRKRSPVEEALKMVLGSINEADGREMVGRRPKKVEIEVESGEMDPEHEEEEMELIRALEGMHSGESGGY